MIRNTSWCHFSLLTLCSLLQRKLTRFKWSCPVSTIGTRNFSWKDIGDKVNKTTDITFIKGKKVNGSLVILIVSFFRRFFCDKVSLVRNHRNAPLAIERLLTKEKQNDQILITITMTINCHWATVNKRKTKCSNFNNNKKNNNLSLSDC